MAPSPPQPSVGPAAGRSRLGLLTVFVSVGVLIVVGASMLYIWRRQRAPAAAGLQAPPAPASVAPPDAELMPFLLALGDAMIDSGNPITNVQSTLQTVARSYGVNDAEIVAFPTALIVTFPGSEAGTLVTAAGQSELRLDQISAVFELVELAERGNIAVSDGLAAVRAARELPPAFSTPVIIGGHAVIALGLAILLEAQWVDLLLATALGALVGAFKWLAAQRGTPTVLALLPIGCAFTVTALACAIGQAGGHTNLIVPVIAPLITLLPGAVLSTAVVELATGQMLSGAGRLISGVMRLVLLAFGIAAGAQLVGLPATAGTLPTSQQLGALLPWVGVVVFGVGVVLSSSGRPSSLGWIILVLAVAHAGQIIGGVILGSLLSGFVGALAMAPVAKFVSAQRSGPPTLVTFLPAFWLLVPGSLALVGLTQVMGEARNAGLSTIANAGVTFVSIGLGVLIGLAGGDRITGLVDTIRIVTARGVEISRSSFGRE